LIVSNLSAVPGANTEWGGTMPPSAIRDWQQSDKSKLPLGSILVHAAATARHSA
jgi:hypothetical protein